MTPLESNNKIQELSSAVKKWIENKDKTAPLPCQTFEDFIELAHLDRNSALLLMNASPQHILNLIKNLDHWLELISIDHERAMKLVGESPDSLCYSIQNYDQFMKLVEAEKTQVFTISVGLIMQNTQHAQHIASLFTTGPQLLQLFKTNFMVARRLTQQVPNLFSSIVRSDDFITLAETDANLAHDDIYSHYQGEVINLFRENQTLSKLKELQKFCPQTAIGISLHLDRTFALYHELLRNSPESSEPNNSTQQTEQHTLEETIAEPQNALTPAQTPSQSKTSSSFKSNLTFKILGGFIVAAGITAIALAFTLLNILSVGGLILAGVGIAATVVGIGFFCARKVTTQSIKPEPLTHSFGDGLGACL